MNVIGSTALTGAAGEYLVMSRLLARGFIAALAPQGVPNMDIVVTTVDGKTLCSIQVKTRWQKGADGGWHMGKKHEEIDERNIFYCFVDLGKSAGDNSTVYILPSHIVAKVIKGSHANWLALPGKNNRSHNDSNVRRLLPDYTKFFGKNTEFGLNWLEQYRENWEILVPATNP